MERWRSWFRNHPPRPDLDQPHYSEHNDDYRPALLNTHGKLSAALVAARLLEVLAFRGGTRVKPSLLSQLIELLSISLPVESVQHADEEVTRILSWIEHPQTFEKIDPGQDASQTPELDMMYAADIESRLSVARFALSEGFDLELEYYDDGRQSWPRLRGTPVEILDADDERPLLAILDEGDRHWEIAVQSLRWLMPVTRRSRHHRPSAPRGEVVPFPTKSGPDR
jgi:hypothetical protein